MESIIVACITGVVTLVGVILSNSKSRAVMEVKRTPSRQRSRSTTRSWSAPTGSSRTWLSRSTTSSP